MGGSGFWQGGQYSKYRRDGCRVYEVRLRVLFGNITSLCTQVDYYIYANMHK